MAKPVVAFVLSLIAGIIYLIVGLIVTAAAVVVSFPPSVAGISGARMEVAVLGGIGLVCGAIMIVGSFLMNSEIRSRVRRGAILVLILTIIGARFTVGGFVFGFVLGLIGSILGLVWKPPEQTSPPASSM